MLKRADSLRNRFKIPTEVERWVYSSNDTTEIARDPDDYESIDDSYLANYDPDEKKLKVNRKEQRERVRSILKQVRRKRESAKTPENFDSVISTVSQANDLNKQEKSLSELKINDDSDTLEEEQQQPVEKKSKKLINQPKKFKSVNSNISRAMPGSLQQNITIERTFFKDLFRLSKQRYIAKLNSDFQKRRFTAAQSRKGLFKEKEKTFVDPLHRSHSILVQSNTKTSSYNDETAKREIKSFSAFAKRRSNSILEDLVGDNTKIKTSKLKSARSDDDEVSTIASSGRLDFRKRPNTTLALSHADSSARLSSQEVKLKLDDNKYYLLDGKEPFKLMNPTSDERFKSLISTMTSYNSKLSLQKPEIIVRDLISSNKALQRVGAPAKDNLKRTNLMEMNMKLFEKFISNIN